jgi:hypothetical protein
MPNGTVDAAARFLFPLTFYLFPLAGRPTLASNDLFDGADLTVKVNSETSISLRAERLKTIAPLMFVPECQVQ